jgi:hypothetical protein
MKRLENDVFTHFVDLYTVECSSENPTCEYSCHRRDDAQQDENKDPDGLVSNGKGTPCHVCLIDHNSPTEVWRQRLG